MSTGNLNGSGYTTGLWEDCRIGRSNESNLPLSSKDNIVLEQDQPENNVRSRQINAKNGHKTTTALWKMAVKMSKDQTVSMATMANIVPCHGTIVPCLCDSGGSIDILMQSIDKRS